MADFINDIPDDLPDIEIEMIDLPPQPGDLVPVNGELMLDNIPRLFPRWMLDFFDAGKSFDVQGNQASDMEVLSMKLFFDMHGYRETYARYGDLAIFDNKVGWIQYYIDFKTFKETGEFRLSAKPGVKLYRDTVTLDDAQLIFQKTKFGTWINFPWYLAPQFGALKINPLMLTDIYVKASSAKFEVAKDKRNV